MGFVQSRRPALLLETRRLLIRPFTEADEAAAVRLFTDREFMVRSLEGPLSPNGARDRLRALIALYEEHGYSKLALEEKGGARVVGYCGLGLETIEGVSLPEFGYRLHPEVRGKGLATEAGAAVLTDSLERLRMASVLAIVEEDNHASRRVLEKLRMIYERPVRFHQRSWLLYRLTPKRGSAFEPLRT